jgi:2-keto-4-pentenoate hydratase/2-oxohepta-3-ene-1,7-dioic acid hydratase in catechol pathway
MLDLIARWSSLESALRQLSSRREGALPLSRVKLLAPIPRPGKILAIGLNYADHIREMKHEMPTRQVWFCKHTTAVNAPFDPIQIPKVSTMIDYEVEMVAIIGRGGRHISREDAPSAVFGYCTGNDVSVRDWQTYTPQWMLGKSFDTHAPFGPWITTADEIGDPHSLGVRCFVNGGKRQESNTSNFVFTLWDQIAYLSQAMTLESGDLIFTGTPGGVGAAMNPPSFLKPGDKVRAEIDRLGAIEAECVAED